MNSSENDFQLPQLDSSLPSEHSSLPLHLDEIGTH